MNRIAISLLAGVAAIGFVSSTYAADLIVEAPYAAPGIVDVSGNWDGAYVGVFGGYVWGAVDHVGPLEFSPFESLGGADLDVAGWQLGVKAGADFTVGSGVVVGIVGDVAWVNASVSQEYDDDDLVDYAGDEGEVGYDIDWMASLRGRIGIDAGTFLPYLTAGLAVAHMNHDFYYDGPVFFDTSSENTHIGWTVGAGVEVAVADNMSLNLEYRYSDFGEETYDHGAGDFNPVLGLTTHAVTAGLNFRF